MSNSSSAGDSLSFSVGRNPTTGLSGGVSGWFDIKHWCAETGVITDHSGPNCIFQSGIHHMFRGLMSSAAGVTAASVKTGIWLSGVTTNAARGTAQTTTTYTSLLCAATSTTDRLYPNDSNTTVNLSSGTNMDSNKGVWFGPSSADIYTGQSQTVSLPDTEIDSDTLVIKSNGSQTVNSIFVVDETEPTNPTRAEILLLAGRTVTSGAQTSEDMTAVVLQDGDTLSITYTLKITVA